jgi:hypothetical protein
LKFNTKATLVLSMLLAAGTLPAQLPIVIVPAETTANNISGEASPVTVNQVDVNYTTYSPGSGGSWKFFGSSNYREQKGPVGSPQTAISDITNTHAGSETATQSKVFYSYWSDGAASAPMNTEIYGNSTVGTLYNSAGGSDNHLQQVFTVAANGSAQVLTVYGVALNGGSIGIRASLNDGSTDYVDAGPTAGAEVYPSWIITFTGAPGGSLTVTATQAADGTNTAGQPAMGLIGAILRNASDTPNLQPLDTMSGFTDQYNSIPATLVFYDVSAGGVVTRRSDGRVMGTFTLQQIMDRAIDGDEYDFADGYAVDNNAGSYTMPHRSTSGGYVKMVAKSIYDTVPQRQRVNPGDYASGNRPKITIVNQGSAIQSNYNDANDANKPSLYWYWDGWEIIRDAVHSAEVFNAIDLGIGPFGDPRFDDDSFPPSVLSDHIIFEHMYIHAAQPGWNFNVGIWTNGTNITVQDSWICDLWSNLGREPESVSMTDGSNISYINNFFSGAGESVFTGGAGPFTGLTGVPTNLTIKYNFVYKPRSWERSGAFPASAQKNLIECKNCDNYTVDSNVFENSIGLDQASTGQLVTPRVGGGGTVGPGGGITAVSIANRASHIRSNNNIFFHVNEGFTTGVIDDSLTVKIPDPTTRAIWAAQMVPSYDNQYTNNLILDVDWRKWGQGNANGVGAIGFLWTVAPFDAGTGSPPASTTVNDAGQGIVFNHNTVVFDSVNSVVQGWSTAGTSGTFFRVSTGVPSRCAVHALSNENSTVANNVLSGPVTGDCVAGASALFPMGGLLWNEAAATQTNNCVLNSPTFFGYRVSDFQSITPSTIVRNYCPASSHGITGNILQLEGAIRSGNRATIYPPPQ